MAAKSHQLQIRVTPSQKRALPLVRARLVQILRTLGQGSDPRFALAELSDLLSDQPPATLTEVTADLDLEGLSPFLQNYMAAMIEQAMIQKKVAPPAWTRTIEPLETPYFAAPFLRLRPYLLRVSPLAFKRRNLVVAATVGDRL